MDAGYLTAEAIDADEIETMQPSQANRKRLVLSRLAAMAALGHRPPRFQGLRLMSAARSARVWANVRTFLGMARRLVLRRAG
jgi:coenzyme F420 hydrogenase subunit beta